MAEKTQYVTFYNGRVGRHKRVGHSVRSFRNPATNQIIDFRNIPIYREDGELDLVPTQNGQLIPRTYGEILSFVGKNSIQLHPVVHKDVIAAIRSMRETVSSKNPLNKGRGTIIEHEPEVHEQREYAENMNTAEAYRKLLDVVNDKSADTMFYLASSLGVLHDNRTATVNALGSYVANNTNNWLKLFKDTKATGVLQDVIDKGIVKAALRKQVITLKDGAFYFGANNLGAHADRIYSTYQELLPAIKSETDQYVWKDS